MKDAYDGGNILYLDCGVGNTNLQIIKLKRTRYIPRRRQWHPTPAWKIPWMEEPGRLQSMGSLGVGHA